MLDRWRDEKSSARTYDRDWRNLCAFLRARFGPGPPEPEDIAQQAFFKLGSRRAEDVLESPRAYLFRTAINLTRNELRNLSRRRQALSVSGPLLGGEHDDAPDVERIVIAREQMAFLRNVIDGMPPRHRQYLLASQVEGLTFVAIGQRFEVSPSVVRKTTDEAIMVCQRALATGKIDYQGLSRERSRRP
jgi:RNA polymerase sigma factor (sigma-70 family)